MTARSRESVWRSVQAYLTIGSAVGVSLLGLLSVVDQTVVSGATLAVLALVTFDLVSGRRQAQRADRVVQGLAGAMRDLGRPRSFDETLTAAAPATGLGATRTARSIGLVGVTLGRTARTALPDLERCLASGGTVRVAVVDPHGDGPGEAARRHGVPDGAAVFEHRLQTTVDVLRYLAALPAAGDRLEIRLIPFVPNVALTVIDRGAPHGSVTVDLYAHRPTAQEPSLTVTAARDPRWYAHFGAEFDQIWAAATPLVLTAPPAGAAGETAERQTVDH
ncbi:hypothetical protein [Polymorphospora rubra]|uniref:Uncharacterized protein n=1 Tax=Polymorphospora rubra TaxID=338584 RepID=A0A810N428_9ACTN|nr:hypothetical protein [Polymorphospora rubra]BCJ68136.1 hypothetical protein Prubr_51570 [Polymorphospora rubra]